MLNSEQLLELRHIVFESVAARNPTESTTNTIVETERIVNYLITGKDAVALPTRQGQAT